MFSYVLHENAAALLVRVPGSPITHVGDGASGVGDGGGSCAAKPTVRVRGCIADLFRVAKPGAVMVLMDAAHTLWPAVAATALGCGWRVEWPRLGMKRGPASVLMLERVAADDGDGTLRWSDNLAAMFDNIEHPSVRDDDSVQNHDTDASGQIVDFI